MKEGNFDFLDLGNNEWILRCEVGRELQARYDEAVQKGSATALEAVRLNIRRVVPPAEIIKSDALPELRKVAGGGRRVVTTVDWDREKTLAAAHEVHLRHRGPRHRGAVEDDDRRRAESAGAAEDSG